MYKPTQIEIDKMMEAHSVWLSSAPNAGKQANFSNMDLEGISLEGRNLSLAILSGTKFAGSNLRDASLCNSMLSKKTNFVGANLEQTHISSMNLSHCSFDPVGLSKALYLYNVTVAIRGRNFLRLFTHTPDLTTEEVLEITKPQPQTTILRYHNLIDINPDQFLDLVESGLFSP